MSYRILIVEDETIIGLDLADMLEEAGFETIGIAKDMHAALRFAEKHMIDLATMDVNLAKGTDGVETAVRLWKAHEIRSVFVSASLDEETRGKAAKAHPVGFIDKPVGSEDVVSFVQAHFARQATSS